MKLTLKNIKCWSEKTFDFGQSGICLISGPSGSGKSSLIQAIHFALSGNGYKIMSIGATTCMAQVEIRVNNANLVITRSKNPSRLVLNYNEEVHEDDAAQSIINGVFSSKFETVCYMSQDARKTFTSLNPTDKLIFLESFVFSDVNIVELKNKCKSIERSKNEALISINSKIHTYKELVSSLKVSNEEVQQFLELNMSDLEIIERTTAVNKSISDHDTSIIHSQEEEFELNHLLLKLKSIEINRINCLTKLESFLHENEPEQEIISDNLFLKNITDAKALTNVIDVKRDSDSCHRLITDCSQSIQLEIEENEEKLFTVSTRLKNSGSIEELNDMIDTYDAILPDAERVAVIERIIDNPTSTSEDLCNEIKKLEYNRMLIDLKQCPGCKLFVRMDKNNRLVRNDVQLTSDDPIPEVSESMKKIDDRIKQINQVLDLKQELSNIQFCYEDPIPEPSIIRSELTSLRAQINSITQDTLLMKSLLDSKVINDSWVATGSNVMEYKAYTKTIATKQNKIKDLTDSIAKRRSKLSSYEQEIFDECALLETCVLTSFKDDLIRYQLRCRQQTERLKQKDVERQKLEEEIRKIDKNISELPNLIEINKKIEGVRREIVLLKEKRLEDVQIQKELEQMSRKFEIFNRRKTYLNKIEVLQSELDILSSEVLAVTNTYNKILDTESYLMCRIIDTINENVRLYLDSFFVDEPISVILSAYKQTGIGGCKKEISCKPQLTIEVNYRGIDCDLNMMSGGEVSRIDLAFTLALTNMFNTPLLLLDESTSSLDSESTNDVCESIQTNFNGELVIMVAHQVVEGVFDTVIRT